ncbi:MAG: chromosome segregation protein SMC [Cytophagales bacterium]|nr:chromosome segregation protein SMC [Cytophagales bacterium]
MENLKNNKIIYSLSAVIALLLGILVYFNMQFSEQKKLLKADLEFSKQNIEELTTELNKKIEEVEVLGGNVKDLQQAKEELDKERKRILKASDYTYRQLLEARKIIQGHKQLLKQKDKEIEQLKEVNESLLTENTELKEDKNSLNKSIRKLSNEKEKLNEKVAFASRLKAEGIQLFAVTKRGKERDGDSWRARHISQLKVSFDIAKNKIAPVGNKEILIQITDENDKVIFDIATGSGTFFYEGKEKFFTAKKNVLYDKKQQQVSFSYKKGSEYEKGKYKLAIYTDGYLMGEKSFTVR